MNQELLRKTAEDLLQLLQRYSETNDEARSLLSALAGFLHSAAAGKILKPLEWREIPGDYMFTEGNLSELPGLEAAYAQFKIEITGGPSDVLIRLRRQFKPEAEEKEKEKEKERPE